MFELDLFLAAWIVIGLVTANPLLQSIQPCPITNYRHHLYGQPYSEQFIIQPNSNPYSQQLLVHNPLSTYQTLQVPSINDYINWEKLLSIPTIRNIIDPNQSTHNYPYNTGGVVNNYIIVPSDYIKINETVRDKKDKRTKNDGKSNKKESVTSNQKRKKVLDNGTAKGKTVDSDKSRKIKQSKDNLYTEGIKCYTPADVLDDGNNNLKTRTRKKRIKNEHNNIQAEKLNEEKIHVNENNHDRSKNSKIKSKKESPPTNCKQDKQVINECKCGFKTDESKIDNVNEEKLRAHCYQDLDDLFNLNCDCSNLENRCTRNSKNDAATKEPRNRYADSPDDVLRSFTWYMNDLFSNPSKMQNTNNMYNYDFNQMYQGFQYSNGDVNKSNRNREKIKNTRSRKKQKKKNSTKKKNDEKAVNKNDNNKMPTNSKTNISSKQPETIIEVTPATLATTSLDTTPTSIATSVIPITTTVPPIVSTTTSIADTITPVAVTSIAGIISPLIENVKPTEVTSSSDRDKASIVTQLSSIEQKNSSIETGLEFFEEPLIHLDVIQNSTDINAAKIIPNKEIKAMEIYETQIPVTISIDKIKEDTLETGIKEEIYDEELLEYDEPPTYRFDESELGSEYEIKNIFDNRLLEDYYPDFKADNYAYFVSHEEVDFQNVHDRYYYTTDKNGNSKETDVTSTDRTHIFKERVVYNDNRSNDDSNEFVNNIKVNDESEEIVFRTPPGLDDPGFRTRKINRDRQDSTEIYYQHTNYDDNFDRFNLDSFADKSDHIYTTAERIMKPNDKSDSFVETVFAGSKVVKYGNTQDSETRLKPAGNHFADVNDTFQYGGDKMVVIAKSLTPEDN